MSLESALVRCWYGRAGWCRILIPFSLLFASLVWLRRRLYRAGWLRAVRLPVPVIVIGNLTAGGTGKTPLAIWLVQRLQAHGFRPGVVSRGHGGSVSGPQSVDEQSEPDRVGDEPLLIRHRAGCPVWVGRRRAEAAAELLAANPDVNVIVADDGLQHYALARDIEIAVVDGRRGLGNGWCLPAGPLREPPSRLGQVAAVVVNGGGTITSGGARFGMALAGSRFRSLREPGRTEMPEYFHGRDVHAVAGIGNPDRFFDTLAELGLSFTRHPFPDHHAYLRGDLPQGTVVMTEKDAVKCTDLGHSDTWALAVDAVVPEGLEQLILNKLEIHDGQQVA